MPLSLTLLFLPPQRATFLGPLTSFTNYHALKGGHVTVFTTITKDFGQVISLDSLRLVI
jgi:hypothetical protein